MGGSAMVTTVYDRTARRDSVRNHAGDNSGVAESIDFSRFRAVTDSAVCRRQRDQLKPTYLGETEPRLSLGMGQLLDPARRRSIIATGTFCAEYCDLHTDWSWEAL